MIVVVDTREKQPWKFDIHNCDTVTTKLDAGDYSLQGYEHKFSIERKKSTGEIANNLGKERKRFERELEILSTYEQSYLICEFPEEYLLSFPQNSGIPRKYWRRLRINGRYLHRVIYELADLYNFSLIFCPNRGEAEEQAFRLIEDYYVQKN